MNLTADEKKEITKCRLENASEMAGGGCGVCERKGFPLLLVRKSVAPKSASYGANGIQYTGSFNKTVWSKNMLTLDGREPSEPLETNEHAFRLLRSGYVYLFLRTRKTSETSKRERLGYEVTASSCFRHRPIRELTGIKNHQVKELPASCTKSNHHIPAKFITVNHTRYSQVWVAYSPHPWSEETIEHYRNLPDAEMVRFTHITLPENGVKPAAELTTQRSFSALDFFNDQRYLMELSCDQYSRVQYYYDAVDEKKGRSGVLASAAKSDSQTSNPQQHDQSAPLAEFDLDTFYSAAKLDRLYSDKIPLQNYIAKFGRIDVPAVLVEDCLGLAEELAVQKTVAIRPHVKNILEKEALLLAKNGQKFNGAMTQFPLSRLLLVDEKNKLRQQDPELYALMYPSGKAATGRDHKLINQQMVANAKAALEQKKNQQPQPYDYYTPAMIHKCRLVKNIEHYEQGIIDKYADKTPAEKLVAFFYADSASADFYRGGNYRLGIKSADTQLTHNGYKNVTIGALYPTSIEMGDYTLEPLTDLEKQALLQQFNWHYSAWQAGKPDLPSEEAIPVSKEVILYRYQPKLYNEELKKYQSLINRPLLTQFKEEAELSYGWMLADLQQLTKDYFYYTTWLIGDAAKPSHFAPKLKRYNSVPFWQQEVEANGSNAHAGYLYDAIAIFKPDHLGSIKLDYQFGLWDNLLRDNNTLYLRLLNGASDDANGDGNSADSGGSNGSGGGSGGGQSLWQTLLAERNKPENSDKSTEQIIDELYKAPSTQSGSATTQLSPPKAPSAEPIDTETVSKVADLLDVSRPSDPQQTKLITHLFDALTGHGYTALANMPRGEVINRLLTQKHLAESAAVLFGAKVKVYSFNVTAADLRYAVNNLSKINPTIVGLNGQLSVKTASGQNLLLQQSEKGWILPKAYAKQVVTLEVVTIAKTAAESAQIEAQFNRATTFNQFAKNNPYVMHIDSGNALTKADIDIAFDLKRRQIKIEESKTVLFNGLLLAFQVYNLSTQYGKYDLTVTQDIRDKMRGEMSRAILDIMLLLPPLAESGSKLAAASLSQLLGSKIKDSGQFIRMSALLGLGVKIAGLIGSAAQFYDGAISCMAGFQRYKHGESAAAAYMVGSVLQMGSAALAAIALIAASLILALVALIFGVIAMVLLYLFRDPSEEWDLMQHWFNRCYFGRWSHQDTAAPPYPLTDMGAYITFNDYLVALLNCQVDIALEDSTLGSTYGYDSYIAQTTRGQNLQRKLQLNLFLSDFNRKKSSFVGRVQIRSKTDPNKYAILQLSDEPEYIKINQISSSLPNWHYRPIESITLNNKEEYSVLDSEGKVMNLSEPSVTDSHTSSIQEAEQTTPVSFLRASQILGTVDDSMITSPYQFEVVIKYLRDKDKPDAFIMINYEYGVSP